MNKTLLRGIGCVLAGMVTGAVPAIVTDVVLEKTGSYVTAKLAPDRPMFYVLIGAAIGFVVCVIGTIVMWDKGSHWYPIALAVLTPPTAWLGGKLATRWSRYSSPART